MIYWWLISLGFGICLLFLLGGNVLAATALASLVYLYEPEDVIKGSVTQ